MAVQILLVEDNDLLAEAIAHYLTAIGYAVHREPDAQHALAHLVTASAALGVLDDRLPGMDGITLCTEVRKRWAMPILLMTGADSEEVRQRASAAGAAATLQKPMAFKELAQAIAHLLPEKGACPRQPLSSSPGACGTLHPIMPSCAAGSTGASIGASPLPSSC